MGREPKPYVAVTCVAYVREPCVAQTAVPNTRCCGALIADGHRPSWGDGYIGPGTYPKACSKISDFNYDSSKAIPKLFTADVNLQPELLQVIIVHRHGARTSASRHFVIIVHKYMHAVIIVHRHGARTSASRKACWPGYETSVAWDCTGVGSAMRASPARAGQDAPPPPLLFGKAYDAGPNELPSTCEVGMLLAEGHQQLFRNGQLLRQAYVGNQSYHLFPSPEFNESLVTFRSDDEQRTITSAQQLLMGMLELKANTTVQQHTGDLDVSALRPNPELCPALSTAKAEALTSDGWHAMYADPEVQQLTAAVAGAVGVTNVTELDLHSLADCIVPALCTDQAAALPPGLQPTLVRQALAQAEAEQSYIALYNNSRSARLGCAHLVTEIAGLVQQTEAAALSGQGAPSPYLHIYSAHDSTLRALLAALAPALWDTVWPAYASMLAIETYLMPGDGEMTMPSIAVRLVFNGRVLEVAGCNAPPGSAMLCPTSAFYAVTDTLEEDVLEACTRKNIMGDWSNLAELAVSHSRVAQQDALADCIASGGDAWRHAREAPPLLPAAGLDTLPPMTPPSVTAQPTAPAAVAPQPTVPTGGDADQSGAQDSFFVGAASGALMAFLFCGGKAQRQQRQRLTDQASAER
ncbi:histidine phosphatase superfamily [Tribonema minus]|uniref:Histidine phosphatase superfamily n=1 Tax=Tribonema minus TaxID=303371 RepID=A0A836CMP1_9STRA|nr:histidine phosphatase superfamily [Tribonema minus]